MYLTDHNQADIMT